MPVALTDKIVGLLLSLTNDQIEALPPAERRRLEHVCLGVAVRCMPEPTPAPKEGILASLKAGERGH